MIVNKPKKKKKMSRYTAFYVIMAVVFSVIIGKLIYIQIYKGAQYADKADVSSTRFISDKAPRGKIYDSEGNVLATNVQTYALTYTTAKDAEKNFYNTIDSVLKILSQNGEEFQDNLLLKIDNNGKFYFDFKTSDPNARRAIELRFKRDRGFEDEIKKKEFPKKQGDFNDSELKKIDDELLKITPEETFYKMVKMYNMYDLINPTPTDEEIKAYTDMSGKDMANQIKDKYSYDEIRKYMVVKDAVKMQSFKGYRSVTIASNIKKDTAFIIYQKLSDLPGIGVALEPIRYYPYKNLASSVIGYVSPIDSSKKENYELRGYDVSSDLIGVSGIESSFENELKGIKGGTTVKVDSKGKQTEKLFELETYPGNDVHLTIDKNVQYAAQEGLKDTLERIRREGSGGATRGAAIAVDVNTGKVVAMASYPDYDPNLFSVPGKLSAEDSQKYFNPNYEEFYKKHKSETNATGSLDYLFPKNEESGLREDRFDIYPRSFFNYATQGLVTPGSVFKPVTSYAGLKEGVITPSDIIVDEGKYIKKDLFTKDDAPQCMAVQFGYTHGPTDLRKALEVSCNYYYYEVGYRLYTKHGSDVKALDSIAKYAWEFGLGVDPKGNQSASTGIEIAENFGQTYNFESWKNSKISTALFYLVPELEKGEYGSGRGKYTFVPFDIMYSEDDPEDLKAAKQDLKNKIKERLEQAGVKEAKMNFDAFSEYILPDVKKIMDLSDKYKNSLASAKLDESAIKKQAKTVSDAIAQFTVSDMGIQITTPAELITDAIGQSMNTFTPIQLASYTATLANGGTRYNINLVDKVTSPTGELIKEYKPEVINKIDIDPSYLQAIKDGMYRTSSVPSSGYTYELFGNFPIKVAGKTGTADFTSKENYELQGREAYSNYISFAPLDKPELAVFVSVYDGKHGSASASVAKAIYEAYFKDRLLQMDPDYGSKSSTFKKYVLDSPLKDNKNGVVVTPDVTEKEDKPKE